MTRDAGPAVDWMVSTADFLMNAYSLSLEEAVFGFSVVAAAALVPAATHRGGGELDEQDLATKARLRARQRAEKVLREEFRIIP